MAQQPGGGERGRRGQARLEPQCGGLVPRRDQDHIGRVGGVRTQPGRWKLGQCQKVHCELLQGFVGGVEVVPRGLTLDCALRHQDGR